MQILVFIVNIHIHMMDLSMPKYIVMYLPMPWRHCHDEVWCSAVIEKVFHRSWYIFRMLTNYFVIKYFFKITRLFIYRFKYTVLFLFLFSGDRWKQSSIREEITEAVWEGPLSPGLISKHWLKVTLVCQVKCCAGKINNKHTVRLLNWVSSEVISTSVLRQKAGGPVKM